MNTDNLTKNFSCEECTMVFDKKLLLKKHNRTIHGTVSNSKCDKCPKSFKSSFSLKRHIRAFHEGNSKYKCTDCGKTFCEAYTLKRHENSIHNKIRNFECAICRKAFGRSDKLKIHYNKKHENSNVQPVSTTDQSDPIPEDSKTTESDDSKEKSKNQIISEDIDNQKEFQGIQENKTFSCEECSTYFIEKIHLERHNRIVHYSDSKIQCDKCEKRFNIKSVLRNHLAEIHGENSIKCKECNKGFGTENRLNRHVKFRHDKVKNYKCDICGKGFS